MQRTTLLALGCLPWLTACQWLPNMPGWPATESQLQPRSINWERQAAGCQGELCSLLHVESLSFPGEPELDALIEARLLELALSEEATPGARSLLEHAGRLLPNAPERWQSWLQAKLIDQHGDVLVVELSSYLFTGGAHGIPGRGFINYSCSRKQALRLTDIILPGREDAFWNLARAARRAWLQSEGLDQDRDFQASWPFVMTDNVALLRDRIQLKYDVYAMAPYSMGHPVLDIPYGHLQEVLRPEFLLKP